MSEDSNIAYKYGGHDGLVACHLDTTVSHPNIHEVLGGKIIVGYIP